MDACGLERIEEFIDLKGETSSGIIMTNWPSLGALKIENLKITFGQFKAIEISSLNIKGGSKIAVVGRTGSGKSTFLNAFFRPFIYEGSILIDGVNINDIQLNSLRKQLCLISQDPVLFQGSVRENLDLLQHHDDFELNQIREKLNFPLDLDYRVDKQGSNLSVGERQLICLGRAMLRNSRFICIDEATAHIDDDSDFQIQKSLSALKDTTILCVAHRMRSIIDFDKVIVLYNGEIVEFNSPKTLISNPASYFLKLCKDSGDYEHILQRLSRSN
eukprot:NODE_41_length_34096_cov_2.002235.p15 type:complete len:274 gc:universal NODE_41_length_34096_cov_2.002235:13630-14451(+)